MNKKNRDELIRSVAFAVKVIAFPESFVENLISEGIDAVVDGLLQQNNTIPTVNDVLEGDNPALVIAVGNIMDSIRNEQKPISVLDLPAKEKAACLCEKYYQMTPGGPKKEDVIATLEKYIIEWQRWAENNTDQRLANTVSQNERINGLELTTNMMKEQMGRMGSFSADLGDRVRTLENGNQPANALSNQQAQYNQSLIDACSKGLYGTHVTLDDIYIEPTGTIINVDGKGEGNSLHKRLINWCKKGKENVCLVEGDPGSGKSSLLKETAKDLANDKEKVLLLELYDIGITSPEDPYKNIRDYIHDEYPWAESRDTILILDGLDEIKYKVFVSAVNLLNQIYTLLPHIPYKKIIISGRCSIFESIQASKYNYPTFLVADLCSKINASITGLPKKPAIICQHRDIRKDLWHKFESDHTFNLPMSIYNTIKSYRNMSEISHSPLLLFLLAVVLGKTEDEDERNALITSGNSTNLYRKMIESAFRRRHGRCGPENNLAFNRDEQLEDFMSMMREIGAVAWCRNSKSISLREINEYCIIMGEGKRYESWFEKYEEDMKSPPYLHFFAHLNSDHRSGLNEDTEFVFLHKSFFEYLAAEEIFNRIKELASSGKNRFDSYVRLQYLFGWNSDTESVYKFIEDLADIAPDKFMGNLMQAAEFSIMSDNIDDYREIALKYERNDWASNDSISIQNKSKSMISSLAVFHQYFRTHRSKINIEHFPINDLYLHDCRIKSLYASEHVFNDTVIENCIFTDKYIVNLNNTKNKFHYAKSGARSKFIETKWAFARWLNCDLMQSNFSRASLTYVDIKDTCIAASKFTGTRLYYIHAQNSSFSGCGFTDTRMAYSIEKISSCDFSHAVFEGGTFKNLCFEDCSFEDAVITGTKFDNCCFSYCNFTGVTFTDVDMEDTFYSNCEIAEEKWKGAECYPWKEVAVIAWKNPKYDAEIKEKIRQWFGPECGV